MMNHQVGSGDDDRRALKIACRLLSVVCCRRPVRLPTILLVRTVLSPLASYFSSAACCCLCSRRRVRRRLLLSAADTTTLLSTKQSEWYCCACLCCGRCYVVCVSPSIIASSCCCIFQILVLVVSESRGLYSRCDRLVHETYSYKAAVGSRRVSTCSSTGISSSSTCHAAFFTIRTYVDIHNCFLDTLSVVPGCTSVQSSIGIFLLL